jgi:hypothetical protein
MIQIKKITDKSLLDLACSYTSGQPVDVKNMEKMYLSEHSPIRTQLFLIEMQDIPTFVSVHLVRHNQGVMHFVKSNRIDSGSYSGDKGRLQPVNHMMIANAQALINMARKRLCGKASIETQQVMLDIKAGVYEIDKELASCMVMECEYRNGCHEFKSCGRWSQLQ